MYDNMYMRSDVTTLMNMIQALVFGINQKKHNVIVKLEAPREYFNYMMHKDNNKVNFYNNLDGLRMVMYIERIKLSFSLYTEQAKQALYPHTATFHLTPEHHVKMADWADEEFHSIMIVQKSNNSWYQELVNSLNNDWVQGLDCYPKMEAVACRLHQLFQTTYKPIQQQQQQQQLQQQYWTTTATNRPNSYSSGNPKWNLTADWNNVCTDQRLESVLVWGLQEEAHHQICQMWNSEESTAKYTQSIYRNPNHQ